MVVFVVGASGATGQQLVSVIRSLISPQKDNEKAAEYLRMEIGKSNEFIEWVAVRPDTLTNESEISDYEICCSPTRSQIFNPGMTSIISLLLIIVLLAGCGLTGKQIAKTQSFGTATASIGKLGEEEFVNIRNGIIEMNKELVVIDNTKTADSLVLDKPTYAVPTAKRVAACKALNIYGELLSKLVSEDRSENLQKAANLLLDNMSIALEKDLSDEKKGAINKIIVGLGSFWVEKKKADAAKEIISAYERPVVELADLLNEDFSLDNNSSGYLKAYEITAKRLGNASMKLINAGDKYSVLERDHAVRAFVMSETAITRANELSSKAKKAINGLKKANAELVKVINNQEYSTDDIKSYAGQIQELVNMYQVLSK